MKDILGANYANYKEYCNVNGTIATRKALGFIVKISGDLKPKSNIDINIIYNEINTDVEKKMSEMKKKIFDSTIIDVDAEILEDNFTVVNWQSKEKENATVL